MLSKSAGKGKPVKATHQKTHFTRWAVIVAAMALSTGSSVFAQTGRLGSTFTVKAPDAQVNRWGYPTYDAVNDAYLVVWGQLPVSARFVGRDGTLLTDSVQLNTSQGRSPTAIGAACGVEACLAAWIEEKPFEMVGRLLRYNAAAGQVEFLTQPFSISLNGRNKDTESRPAVAYSPEFSEFLVAWMEYDPSPDIKAQRVTPSGSLSGGEIAIAQDDDLWEGRPSATYNSQAHEYLVAYYWEHGPNYLAVQRVQPGTGLLLGRNTVFGSSFEKYPEIAYNAAQNTYLAITWAWASNNWMLHGQLIDANGYKIGDVLPLAAQGGGPGLGLTYNGAKNAWFAVFQSQKNDEMWGVEINAAGTPASNFQVTLAGATSTYIVERPGVAADSRANTNGTDGRMLAASALGYRQIIGQVLGEGGDTGSTAPPPPPVSVPCTTPKPGPDWVCTASGDWVPPAPSSGGTTSGCSSIQPGADWVCDPSTGNWLPPSSGGTNGGTTGACTTPRPGPDWVCTAAGNWVPPSNTGTSSGGTTGACTTPRPGPDWVCTTAGNWVPPGSTGTSSGGTTGACTTPKPGPDWVCTAAGNWVPPGGTGTSSTGGTTSACTTPQPGAGWICNAATGGWLPPNYVILPEP